MKATLRHVLHSVFLVVVCNNDGRSPNPMRTLVHMIYLLIGRTIASERAIEMLVHKLPGIVQRSLLYEALDPDDLQNFVTCYRDQESLRKQLKAHSKCVV